MLFLLLRLLCVFLLDVGEHHATETRGCIRAIHHAYVPIVLLSVLGELAVLLLVDRIYFLEILLVLVFDLGVGVAHLDDAGIRPGDFFHM